MTHFHEVTDELRAPYRQLSKELGGVMGAYAELHREAMAEGQLPAKHKELIALAIAITRECDGCVAAHARGAVRRGASRAEVVEMIGVAILMNGGPGTVWGPRALAAYEEYAGPEPTD